MADAALACVKRGGSPLLDGAPAKRQHHGGEEAPSTEEPACSSDAPRPDYEDLGQTALEEAAAYSGDSTREGSDPTAASGSGWMAAVADAPERITDADASEQGGMQEGLGGEEAPVADGSAASGLGDVALWLIGAMPIKTPACEAEEQQYQQAEEQTQEQEESEQAPTASALPSAGRSLQSSAAREASNAPLTCEADAAAMSPPVTEPSRPGASTEELSQQPAAAADEVAGGTVEIMTAAPSTTPANGDNAAAIAGGSDVAVSAASGPSAGPAAGVGGAVAAGGGDEAGGSGEAGGGKKGRAFRKGRAAGEASSRPAASSNGSSRGSASSASTATERSGGRSGGRAITRGVVPAINAELELLTSDAPVIVTNPALADSRSEQRDASEWEEALTQLDGHLLPQVRYLMLHTLHAP